MNCNKGIKIIPRVLNFLPPERIVAFVATVFTRLECVDVCHIPLGVANEAV